MLKETKCNLTIATVCRWIVGIVFLFSSFTKGVDPIGTAYKIQEYMTAWTIGSLSFEWALPLADIMAVTLITVEFVIGVLLITGAFRRLSAWLLVLMMLFFTATTLIDAITNKVTDCGCFGDAVKLTNWQTFWKNVALDVPTVWIFLTRNMRLKRRFERDATITIFAIAAMVLFQLYNISNEPCIDFRPWKKGNVMMSKQDGAEIKTYFTYRNTATGQTRDIESAQLMELMADPEWANQWEWQASHVIDPYEILAPGFSMLDTDGEDHSREIIGSDGLLIITTIHHLDKVSERGLHAIQNIATVSSENGIRMVLLTSALPEEVQAFLYNNNMGEVEFYLADDKAIETMLRSNPGFVMMEDATVLGKWHYRNVSKLTDYINDLSINN
ncbi:MAG: DoxX family protein [Bacteroidales bacterium]|nr:DoxX family protein [Bacteroidales bacterium]